MQKLIHLLLEITDYYGTSLFVTQDMGDIPGKIVYKLYFKENTLITFRLIFPCLYIK